jgi:uncharacterized membrane protein
VEEFIKTACGYIALLVEAVAALVIAYGTIEAVIELIPALGPHREVGRRRKVWRRFGVWLLLGLEFELAADIIRTAISPSWTDIGQLAAIAAIRTFLNFFLEEDIEKLQHQNEEKAAS